MGRIKRQITVAVKTEDGKEHHLEMDEVRTVGGAFLTAVSLYPNWAKIIMTIVKN